MKIEEFKNSFIRRFCIKGFCIKRFWWLFVILGIIVIFSAFLVFNAIKDKNNGNSNIGGKSKNGTNTKSVPKKFQLVWPDPGVKTITASPFDLNQIKALSKYRSCAGHNRAGYNFNKELETDRSMKHYIEPVESLRGTKDKIKLFAPFDGKIVMIQKTEVDSSGVPISNSSVTMYEDGSTEESPIQKLDGMEGRKYPGDDYDLVSPIDPNAVFGLRHVVPVKNWKLGDTVKAGELIGYASLGNVQNDFDVDYVGRTFKLEGEKGIEIMDSMFNHMTDSVLAEYAKFGLTPENTKFTKAERDAEPCGYDPVTKYDSKVCGKTARSSDPVDNNCFVWLRKKD